MIQDESIEGVWKRTHVIAEAFREGMKALGMEIFSQSPADSVTAIKYPAGVTDKDFRGHSRASTTSTSPAGRAPWKARSSASITWTTATPTTPGGGGGHRACAPWDGQAGQYRLRRGRRRAGLVEAVLEQLLPL